MNPDGSTSTPPISPSAEPQIAAPVPASSLPTPPKRLLTAPLRTSWGAFIGISILLAGLVIGALYFWGARLAERDATLKDSTTSANTETQN